VLFYGTPFSFGKSGNRAFQEPRGEPNDADSLRHAPRCDVFIAHGTRSRAVSQALDTTGCGVAITGHDHDLFGASLSPSGRLHVVASTLDNRYHVTNVPIVFDLPLPKAYLGLPPAQYERAAPKAYVSASGTPLAPSGPQPFD
jgi:hypothetical protein